MSLYGQNVIVNAALREELQVNRDVVSSYAYAYALGQLSSAYVQSVIWRKAKAVITTY